MDGEVDQWLGVIQEWLGLDSQHLTAQPTCNSSYQRSHQSLNER